MELTSAMIDNKSLFVDPYVASLVPPVLTCLVARHLGPEGGDNLKDQFQLRDLAASLIGKMSRKYAESSVQLRPRLTRTCLKYFLDPSRTLGEHYGAICGLRTIGGPDVVRSVLLPNVKPFEYVITKAISERGASDESVAMVIGALVKSVASISEGTTGLTNGNGNGMNGVVSGESTAIEEFLGKEVGSRVLLLNDRGLNKAILETREKLK